ncbi:hypothetical protein N9937_01350 [bacterium]|nr:hypothetical protein [bacterium]
MGIAEYNYEDFQTSQQSKQDETLLVKFFIKSVEDKGQTLEQGRPVFREREYIDIRIPGSRDGASRPCTHKDKQRFPKHYAAFQQRVEKPEEGTPLVEWGAISRTTADEMAFHNIKTVEQLAGMSDNLAGQFMSGGAYKQKAQRFLEATKENLTIEKLQEELNSRDSLLSQLQEQIDELRIAQETE